MSAIVHGVSTPKFEVRAHKQPDFEDRLWSGVAIGIVGAIGFACIAGAAAFVIGRAMNIPKGHEAQRSVFGALEALAFMPPAAALGAISGTIYGAALLG